MTSKEGFQWTQHTGLQAGLPTLGYIHPQSRIKNESKPYDTIIIGAGYAGLTAARDLTTTGNRVLLLEARDRIGGRTWSSNIDGYPFELGGTWIHWNQPHVYREISRYGLQENLENSHDPAKGVNVFVAKAGNQSHTMPGIEEGILMDKLMRRFINVDGTFGRTVCPMPGSVSIGRTLAHYDKMSLQDRLNEMQFDPVEEAVFEGFLAITCGASNLEDASFGEMIRWWSLNNYDMQLFMEQCLTYKLGSGQSSFARNFFDEAATTGRLDYGFGQEVRSVVDTGDEVTIITSKDTSYRARSVVCTIPLNVMTSVEFSPPLPSIKVDMSRQGHVNQVSKVHVECTNPELRSFSGMVARPYDKLTYMFGDGTTPAGNTHLVSFGSSFRGEHLHAERDVEETKRSLANFADMDIRRVVFHNWSADPFSKGAWEWLRPGMIANDELIKGLRGKHGNIFFASADWALLWRGFIDGAIEEGARAAVDVNHALHASPNM